MSINNKYFTENWERDLEFKSLHPKFAHSASYNSSEKYLPLAWAAH